MKQLKILVVDDDPVTRALLKKRLQKEDYEVETANDGQQAVQRIQNNFFDVILTDLMMPGNINGIGVLEAAKENNFKTEVILITAFASIENAIEAMKKGASDYLQKPINLDELLLKLEKINHLKCLLKNAYDLREAMDITEKTSAETIQQLELAHAGLMKTIDDIHMILSDNTMDAEERIEKVLSLNFF